MMKYKNDGVTLFFLDKEGNEHAASPFQERYYSFLLILGQEQDSERTNNSNVQKYLRDLHDFQLLIDGGRLGDAKAPPKPRQIIVEITVDENKEVKSTINSIPFPAGALPDPIYPNITPSSTSLRANVPDIQLNLLLNINKKLDQVIGMLNQGK